jgi:hypothetical protein
LGGLLGQPQDQVGFPVGDVAAVAEAAGPDAEVAVVAQRPERLADEHGGFGQVEDLVA